MQFLDSLRARPLYEHLLRGAVAFAFLYPPIAALGDAPTWIGYIPIWVSDMLPVADLTLLHMFGALEVILALWILLARSVRMPAFLAAGILLFITITNSNQFAILFRDVAIAFAALALALMPQHERDHSADTTHTNSILPQ